MALPKCRTRARVHFELCEPLTRGQAVMRFPQLGQPQVKYYPEEYWQANRLFAKNNHGQHHRKKQTTRTIKTMIAFQSQSCRSGQPPVQLHTAQAGLALTAGHAPTAPGINLSIRMTGRSRMQTLGHLKMVQKTKKKLRIRR